MSYYILTIGTLFAINVILVLGLNVQFGYAGVLNFGYIAFVAIGSYVTSATSLGGGSSQYYVQQYILGWNLPWPLPVILGGLASAAMGLLVAFIAIRRLRSDYLAISTIAMSLVLWTVIGNETWLFNGWQGVAGVPRPFASQLQNAPQVASDAIFFGICVAVAVLVFIACRQLYHTPLGRSWRAVREDDVAAESSGHPSFQRKLSAFVVGCFIAGIGGGLLAEYATAFSTSAWLPLETFFIWAAMIVGGPGNYLGAVLGAAIVLVGLNEGTRYLPSVVDPATVQALRGVAIGVLMLLVLKFRPEGLIPERRIHLYKREKGARLLEQRGSGSSGKEASTP